MDEADLAQTQQEQMMAAAIANARKVHARPSPKGFCYNCEAPFGERSAQLFCDVDCEADYRARVKRTAQRFAEVE